MASNNFLFLFGKAAKNKSTHVGALRAVPEAFAIGRPVREELHAPRLVVTRHHGTEHGVSHYGKY